MLPTPTMRAPADGASVAPVQTNADEILERIGGDSLAGSRPTLHGLSLGFLRWLEVHGHPEHTVRAYGDGLGAFLTFSASAELKYPDQVTILVLDTFFAWLQDKGLKASTIAHRRSILISFWRWLEHEGFADRNIAAKTYPIKTAKRLPVYLEPHQIDEFLDKLASLPDLIGRRDHAMVATFFYAGLRVSELTALRVEDVDLTAARLRVNLGKGAKDRVLYIPPRLAPILKDYIERVRPELVNRPVGRLHRRGSRWHVEFQQGGRRISRAIGDMEEEAARRVLLETVPQPPAYSWLFANASASNAYRLARGGQPLLTRSIYNLIRRRAREILNVKLSPHKLRHTCASYMLYHGAALETIQRVLGHENIKTTMIYLHVPQRKQEEEIDRIFGDRPKRRPRQR